MQIDQHPVVKWLGVGVIVSGVLWSVVTFWWDQQAQKLSDEKWLQDDIKWNAEQISKMDAITVELATQTLRLAEIEALGKRILDRQDRFNQKFQYQMGLHNGQHQAELCTPATIGGQ